MAQRNSNLFYVLFFALLVTLFMMVIFLAVIPSKHGKSEQTQITKEQIEAAVKDYIMSNPKIILDATEKFYVTRAKEQQEEMKKNISLKSKELEQDADDPRVGNGKVKIVEIFDYNCTYCKQMALTKNKLIESNKDVQIIFKEVPMFGENSLLAAKAALAVNKLDSSKYFAFQTELLQHAGALNEAAIQMATNKLGLDWNVVKQKMQDKSIIEHMQRNIKLAQDIGINGTPAYIINGEVIPGKIDLNDLQKLIDGKK